MNDAKADLIADIFEKKQKLAISQYYESLRDRAAIDNYLTRESQNPNVEKSMGKITVR
jgi:hypothetical protein